MVWPVKLLMHWGERPMKGQSLIALPPLNAPALCNSTYNQPKIKGLWEYSYSSLNTRGSGRAHPVSVTSLACFLHRPASSSGRRGSRPAPSNGLVWVMGRVHPLGLAASPPLALQLCAFPTRRRRDSISQ